MESKERRSNREKKGRKGREGDVISLNLYVYAYFTKRKKR